MEIIMERGKIMGNIKIDAEYMAFTGENVDELKQFTGANTVNTIIKNGKVVLYLYFYAATQATIKVPINDCVIKIGRRFITVPDRELAAMAAEE